MIMIHLNKYLLRNKPIISNKKRIFNLISIKIKMFWIMVQNCNYSLICKDQQKKNL
jgi:hypothetical protein